MPKFPHLVSTTQLNRSWIESELFPLSDKIRTDEIQMSLPNKSSLYCLFYEPSFLTRTSFERAIELLGGRSYHTEDASQFFPIKTPNYIDDIIKILASLHINLVVIRSSQEGILDRASATNALPVINGGSSTDHPTQALADLYTINREMGKIDNNHIAIVGRMEHRNVYALLKGLSLFEQIKVTLVPFSGQLNPELIAYCQGQGMDISTSKSIEDVRIADVIYLNAPRTISHAQILKSRQLFDLKIDDSFLSTLKPGSIIMDPMQRSGDFDINSESNRLAFYRQAENALFVRMAVLHDIM